MRIQMNTTAAGPEGCFDSGHEYEVSEDLGNAWVSGGFASEVRSGPPPEAPIEAEPDPSVERAVGALSRQREQATAEESEAERAVEDDRRKPKKKRGRKSKPKKVSGG
jgi:hypothetical protein